MTALEEQQALDHEDANLHWRRIIALRRAETTAMERVGHLRSEYAVAIRDHKKARAELDAALDAEMRPCPLFDGASSPLEGEDKPAGASGRPAKSFAPGYGYNDDTPAALHSFADAERRWEKLVKAGASDDDLRFAIGVEFSDAGGIYAGPDVRCSYKGGGKAPAFWLGERDGKPTLAGKALVDKVRALLAIPLPGVCGAAGPQGADCIAPRGHKGGHTWGTAPRRPLPGKAKVNEANVPQAEPEPPAEAKIAKREATEPDCGSPGPDGKVCTHLAGHHGAHQWEATTPAAGKLFPDPPPEPEPAPPSPPADVDAAWRKRPVTDLTPAPYIRSVLALRGIATIGDLADRFDAARPIPGLGMMDRAALGDALQGVLEDAAAGSSSSPAAVAGISATAAPDGWPWPGGLTEDVLRRAYVADAVAKVNRAKPKPARADPFEWEGLLWVCVSMHGDRAEVLPLILASNFEERYIQYPTSYFPDPARLNLPTDDERRKQWWTGVVVKVGRKEWVIAPAGEARTLTKEE